MNESAKIIAAAVFLTCPSALAWAQQTQSGPPAMFASGQSPSDHRPFVQLEHGGVYPGAHTAPAMSLKDVAPHPAELSGRVPRMTFVAPDGAVAHMMPTVQVKAARLAAGLANPGGPLVYHAGGPIMVPDVQVYAIFWGPSLLQNGGSTGFSANYGLPTLIATAWLQSHGLMNIATQYFQTINSTTTYFQNTGGLQTFVVDSGAYPASGCSDLLTPGNCITDAQIRAKIQAVMTAQGWTPAPDRIFVLFTSSGEGSCIDNTSQSCAYTQYCGYHSSFSLGGQNVLYVNVPYGNANRCQAVGQTTPNDPDGDLAANTATHEIMETATNPLGNAWFGSSGAEIGDLCGFIFGTNTWGSGAGAGNQMWNGVIMEVQEEFDNHFGDCVQVGPQ